MPCQNMGCRYIVVLYGIHYYKRTHNHHTIHIHDTNIITLLKEYIQYYSKEHTHPSKNIIYTCNTGNIDKQDTREAYAYFFQS